MDLDAYREEVKFKVTGGVLNIELDDTALDKCINAAFRELQRYIATVKLVTLPYAQCINMKDYKVSAVTHVFRAQGYYSIGSVSDVSSYAPVDPMQASFWQLASGTGNMSNLNNYVYNYASWNTLLQIRNTTSTDLAFRYDKISQNLYVNISTGTPNAITIEFIPRFDNVEEITSDYWIDILMRLSVAITKIALGRIRSRYTQSNALWTQDGETMLNEGNQELSELRTYLQENSQLILPID